MTEKDDVVVGVMTGYNWDIIKPWVNSLDTCGFKGHKMVLCYNVEKDVLDKLTERDYTVLAFSTDDSGNAVYAGGKPFSIVVERFFHIWVMLKEYKGLYRYLLHTDMKDVIFQKNPSEFWDEYTSRQGYVPNIWAASESLLYKDEDWGRDNMSASFGPLIYNYMSGKEIVNAGTLSGQFDKLLDFFLNVYMVSVGGKIHNPDQAAVNVLLSQSPYSDVTTVTTPHDAWACQAGTTNDPYKPQYIERLIRSSDGQTYMDEDGIVKNGYGKPFYIVHQYDRIPYWKRTILEKYK
jgi:hypothetical protein